MRIARRMLPILIALAWASVALAQTGKAPAKAAAPAKTTAPTHKPVLPEELKWNPYAPGIDIAVVDGDPDKAGGMFTLRIKTADGSKVPPHWHPTDELVTVLKGTFLFAMGEKYDAKALQAVPVGGFLHVVKEMRHYASCKGEAIVEVHGLGPFKIIYVNPEDDPANKAKGAPAKAPA